MQSPKMVFNKLIDDDSYDVYIGRPSKWKNPFRMRCQSDRRLVIDAFEKFLIQNKDLRHYGMDFLTGKRLGCFCATSAGLSIDDPVICHGQIWLKACRGDYENVRID